MGAFSEPFQVTSVLEKKMTKKCFFSGYSLVHAVQQVNFAYFPSSIDQHCPPNTIDLRSGDRDNPWPLLFVLDKAT